MQLSEKFTRRTFPTVRLLSKFSSLIASCFPFHAMNPFYTQYAVIYILKADVKENDVDVAIQAVASRQTLFEDLSMLGW